jgi:peptidoglycan/xylan/chitin deacetylase (PgdA/CDA1 family)
MGSSPALENAVLRVFRRYHMRQTFAFIPAPAGYGDAQHGKETEMIDSLKSWAAAGAVELALHGYTHVRHGHAGGEFDGLPPHEQDRLIATGKHIADSLLGVPVAIFAPPWNQADVHTLEACRNAGITVFSGYVGAEPVAGVRQVNTNSVLFAQETGLPEPETLLSSMDGARGTVFLVIFYHSRVDFPDSSAFARLDSLLRRLRSDSTVHFSSLGEIAAEGGMPLQAYTGAGSALRRAGQALDRARPYLAAARATLGRLGADLPQDSVILPAYRRYWAGDYQGAAASAQTAALGADRFRLGGRLAIAVIVGILALLLHRIASPSAGKVTAAAVAAAGCAVVALHVFAIVSPPRMQEATVLAAIGVAVCLQIRQLFPGRSVPETLVGPRFPASGR